jgi:hypothetical protein
MTSVTKDYWPAYSGLESQLRDLARGHGTIRRGSGRGLIQISARGPE